jgi:pilus assembly protein CpaB
MSSRGLVMGVAILLATVATMAVYLYVRGVEEDAEAQNETVDVIVATQDIPANTPLDNLLTEGAFEVQGVPRDNVVPGAVTELGDLEGEQTSAAVLAGEQISSARLQGTGELPGGTLGIADGFTALTLPLESPANVAEYVAPNDHVTIYGSYRTDANKRVTTALAESVEVLAVRYDQELEEDKPASNQMAQITLAVEPNDAQRVSWVQEFGELWLALEPPGSDYDHNRPVFEAQVTR